MMSAILVLVIAGLAFALITTYGLLVKARLDRERVRDENTKLMAGMSQALGYIQNLTSYNIPGMDSAYKVASQLEAILDERKEGK